MKKFRVIFSAVALVAVLAFCVTVGIYAAANMTFNINSTISFTAPGVEKFTIECYVVHGQTETLKHTYSTIEGVESDGHSWNLNKDGSVFTYTERVDYEDSDGSTYKIYAPITLKFVIKHQTTIPVYAYFTKGETPQYVSGTEELTSSDGVKLINAEFDDEITSGIAGGLVSDESYIGGEVSITLNLIPNVTTTSKTINFDNYGLVISTSKPDTGATA